MAQRESLPEGVPLDLFLSGFQKGYLFLADRDANILKAWGQGDVQSWVGKNVRLFIPEAVVEDILQQVKTGVEGDEIQHFTVDFPVRGEDRGFYISILPDLKDGKAAEKIWVLADDISTYDNLAHNLKTKEHDLMQARKTKDEFLNHIGHELRTPMNAIMGMVDLLLETPLSLKQKDYSQAIMTASEDLLELLNKVIDYSGLETGRIRIQKKPFFFQKKLRMICQEWRSRARKKGLALKYHIDPEIPSVVVGDEKRISQIIENLLSNSIKYTDEGEISLRTNYSFQEDFLGTFSLEVQDTGIGIPQGLQEEVFQSFRRIDSASKRKASSGSGLGLSIARDLAEAMGGEILLNSKVGQGSIFTLRLPMRSAQDISRPSSKGDHEEKDSSREGFPDSDSPAPKRTRRIEISPGNQPAVLLVEDNMINIRVAGGMLEVLGFPFKQAENGEEALQVYKEDPCPLILMDIRMPLLNGYQATKAIRAWEEENQWDPAVIIAMTAHSSLETERLCEESGMDGIIVKPVKKDNLERTLHQFINFNSSDNVGKSESLWPEEKVFSHQVFQERVQGDSELARHTAVTLLEDLEGWYQHLAHLDFGVDKSEINDISSKMLVLSTALEASNLHDQMRKILDAIDGDNCEGYRRLLQKVCHEIPRIERAMKETGIL